MESTIDQTLARFDATRVRDFVPLLVERRATSMRDVTINL
ncbi:three-helix bundle dimerization domain-containing protein [Rhodococcus koreensis]